MVGKLIRQKNEAALLEKEQAKKEERKQRDAFRVRLCLAVLTDSSYCCTGHA